MRCADGTYASATTPLSRVKLEFLANQNVNSVFTYSFVHLYVELKA